MDFKEKLKKEINRIVDRMAELDPLSQEYQQLKHHLTTFQEMLQEEERLDMESVDKSHGRDLKEQELDERVIDSKRRARSTIWAAIIGLFGTIVAGGVALIGQDKLIDTKEMQGAVDRDVSSMVRSTYPKM